VRQVLTIGVCVLATAAIGLGWVTFVDSRVPAGEQAGIEDTVEWVLGSDDPDTCTEGYTARLFVHKFDGDGTPFELCRSTLRRAEVDVVSIAIEGTRATATAELSYSPRPVPGPANTVRVALLKQDHWRLDQIVPVGADGNGSGAAVVEVEDSAAWDGFARLADLTCWERYSEGIQNERETELIARHNGWSRNETEAAIRFSWADVLRRQHRQIVALGPPPSRIARYERWRAMILRRARLYKDEGHAWLDGGPGSVQRAADWVNSMKFIADQLAGPLPFEICGTHAPSR
jgi:hypothetical protein